MNVCLCVVVRGQEKEFHYIITVNHQAVDLWNRFMSVETAGSEETS